MTIEKLKSGNYRVSEQRNGRRVRFTVDHKPTKAEARSIIENMFHSYSTNQPFAKACEGYIESKKDILSPTTIKNYHSMKRAMSDRFLNTPVCDITLPVLQTEVNRYSKDHSPKSVKNFSGFIVGVIKFYGGDIRSPKLPQMERKDAYIPTADDVKAILCVLKGTKYEVPILLASLGLRKSEICALTLDDLDGNTLTINKALVQNEQNEWVIKTTKTTSSTRTVLLPEYLSDLIRSQGEIYSGHPEMIYRHLKKAQAELGIPEFPLHKMRHFFASYMHELGMSDKQIQEAGGWKTDRVMKTVYQHAMNMDAAKQQIADSVGSLIT